jgi:hypothetical protein
MASEGFRAGFPIIHEYMTNWLEISLTVKDLSGK